MIILGDFWIINIYSPFDRSFLATIKITRSAANPSFDYHWHCPAGNQGSQDPHHVEERCWCPRAINNVFYRLVGGCWDNRDCFPLIVGALKWLVGRNKRRKLKGGGRENIPGTSLITPRIDQQVLIPEENKNHQTVQSPEDSVQDLWGNRIGTILNRAWGQNSWKHLSSMNSFWNFGTSKGIVLWYKEEKKRRRR